MRRVRGLLIGAAIGVVLGGPLGLLDVPITVAEAVFLAPCAVFLAVVLYCRRARRRAPDRYRAYAAEHFDPAAGPPHGAEPVDEPVVSRWFAAAEAENWRAAAELLDEDFRFVAPHRSLSRDRFVRVMRRDIGLGDSDTLGLATFAHPDEPDVVWVRQDSVGHPPKGNAIRTAAWFRWTFTPDRQRVRRLELVAFVEPLVPA